jgi:serine/threonine protein kinase/tetratricopeptide (TPR) repeat protein
MLRSEEGSPSASLKTSEAVLPAHDEATLAQEGQPGEVINNRYRLMRKLGRGGMGTVYLVHDEWKDRLLAMKRVRKDRLDPRTITILRNEFLALAPLVHPNLAKVYDFEVDLTSQDYFFTSEYVEGMQLIKAAKDLNIGRRGDLLRFLEVLVQILRALEFIHTRGLVHGDIKPENILASAGLHEGGGGGGDASAATTPAVKMIDFGLTKREKEFGGKKIIGTTFYIAPETILGSQVDRRTDLYSLGVVLYQLVTRKLPFIGESNLAVMRGHLEKEPVPPHQVTPEVPEALSRMILKLMEKTPANRYGHALELIEAINSAFATEFPFENPDTRLSYIQSSAFILRESETAELEGLFETTFRMDRPVAAEVDDELNLSALKALPAEGALDLNPPPKGRMILLRGETGVGKRRIIDEFRRFGQTRGVHFIEIIGAPKDEGVHQSFPELLRALVAVLSARFPADMPDQASLTAFIETVEHAEPRALRPIVEKLTGKVLDCCRTTPLVLVIKSVQRADVPTLEFLRALVEKISAGQAPESQIMIAATAEDDDPDDVSLRPLLSGQIRQGIREITLPRFNAEEVGQLLQAMFGGERAFPERFVHLIHEESDGNPGVAREILEFLALKGQVQRTLDGWRSEGAIEREAIPGKVRLELRRRIEKLDPQARRLATAFAILGGASELEIAVRLAELPPGRIVDTIWKLKQERIIREEAGDSDQAMYSFVHSSAREILYDQIPPPDRVPAHDRAGLLLEAHLRQAGREDPRRLAFHFLRAGNADAALRHGLAAAKEYAALHHPRKAIEVYGEVRRFAAARDPASAWEIDRAIGRLHFHIGEYEAARQIFQALSAGKPEGGEAGPVESLAGAEKGAILVELGDALCRLGKFRESMGCLNEALQLLKGKGSTPELATLLLSYADLLHFKGNFFESLRYCERMMSWDLQDPELQARLYHLLAENHYRLDNKEIAIRWCQKGLECLESKHDAGQMALTLLHLGKFYKYKGKFQKALKQLQVCATVNQKIGALDRQADCLIEIGGIHLFLDNPEDALARLSQSIALYERTGNLSRTIEALNLRGDAHRVLGHYEDARKDLERSLDLNKSLGSMQNSSECYLVCGKIAIDHGQLKRAREYLVEAGRHDESQMDERSTLKVISLRLGLEVMTGEFREALDLAAKGIIAGREVGNRLRLLPLLESRMHLYITLGKNEEARRSLSSLFEITQRYGLSVAEGRGLLLEGILLTREGKLDEAGKRFEKALKIFHDGKNERDLINAYLEYGLFQLRAKNHEQAYVLFEDGLFLAKKICLNHAKCRLYHAMALLETSLPEGEASRAESYFLSAERIARAVPYQDLLWRIRHDLGKFYLGSNQLMSAERALAGALEASREQLEKVPESFRESYLAAAGRGDLEKLHAETKARAEAQVRRERVKYPPRNAEGEEYFGLAGRSGAMRDLFNLLASFPPDVPWVWIWGAMGSGRRDVATAIHRQSVPDREGTWQFAASSFQNKVLERFLLELEKARGVASAVAGAGHGEPDRTSAGPARYSLVVLEFSGLDRGIQMLLLDLVLKERGLPDGLRVLATLDRPPQEYIGSAESAAAGEGAIIPDLLTQDFPSVRVPSLGERAEDLPILIEHYLRSLAKSKDAVPRLTAEGLELIKKLPFLKQIADVRSICEKICRFRGPEGTIGPEEIRTILTPTLKIARRK